MLVQTARGRAVAVGRLQGAAARCGVYRGLFESTENKERRLKKREALWAEANKGYFADLHEYKRNRGKRFEAPDHLCSVKEATRFPTLSGKCLSGRQVELPTNQVSLVLISLRSIGMRMCDEYRQPFEHQFKGHSGVSVYELLLIDKLLFKMLKPLMERNLRKVIPSNRQDSFLCYSGQQELHVKELVNSITLGNSIVGHAYLLDGSGNIRWRATAMPTERELLTMLKCTKQLLGNTVVGRLYS